MRKNKMDPYHFFLIIGLVALFGLSINAKLGRIESGLNALHKRLDDGDNEKQRSKVNQ